jgi:hypothetical protein
MSLSRQQRTAFMSIAVNAVPADVLAAELRTSRSAVYKALFEARRTLRAALAAGGHIPRTVPGPSSGSLPGPLGDAHGEHGPGDRPGDIDPAAGQGRTGQVGRWLRPISRWPGTHMSLAHKSMSRPGGLPRDHVWKSPGIFLIRGVRQCRAGAKGPG